MVQLGLEALRLSVSAVGAPSWGGGGLVESGSKEGRITRFAPSSGGGLQLMFRFLIRFALAAGLGGISFGANAFPIDLIKIGTWSGTNSGNPTGVGGPGLAVGQRYVVKISYDSNSTTSTANVLTQNFVPSGQDMTTVNLTGVGNSLDIFVPMPAFDAGTPFIYTQNESDHFPSYIPSPTLNFALGSDISDPANIIGLDFEGNFVAGSGFNVVSFFNTAPDVVSPIYMVGQVLNFGNIFFTSAAYDVPALADAVAVSIADNTVTYDAASLIQTTSMAFSGNDLGAGRSDGENFLRTSWSVAGTTQANNVDIAVAIANSGLTNTADTTAWNVSVTEQMTDLGDSAQVLVDYANASPTASLTATQTAPGVDFAFSASDLDLAVNALIAGFEMLVFSVMVDGGGTAFFNSLLSTGTLSALDADLFAAFGAGTHSLSILVTDLAGARAPLLASFDVFGVGGPSIPEPAPLGLLLTAALITILIRRRTGAPQACSA